MDANVENLEVGVMTETPWRQPLVVWLMVFISGIAGDQVMPLPVPFWLGLSVTNALGAWFARRDRGAVLLLLFGFLGAGGFCSGCYWRLVSQFDIAAIDATQGTPIGVVGSVDGPVRQWQGVHGPRWAFRANVLRIRRGANWTPGCGKVVVLGYGAVSLKAGDGVRLWGVLVEPSPPRNPGETDYRRQLRRERIHAQLRVPVGGRPQTLGVSHRSLPQELQRRASEWTWRQLPHRHAAIAQAMTWGDRSRLSDAQRRRFRTTGTAHYLAISGLHVGMLCALVLGMNRLGWLPRRPIWFGVIGFAFGYALICGARTPILRATWLVVFTVAGRWLGRRPLQWSRLAAAAWAILLTRPTELTSAGAQLSFLAVAILILPRPRRSDRAEREEAPIVRHLRARGSWWRRATAGWLRHVGRAFWLNLRLCLLMAPLVGLHFGYLAPGALLFTPLVGPLVAVALVSCFLLVTLALFRPLSWCLEQTCAVSLAALDGVLSFGDRVMPVWELRPSSGWMVAAFYAAWLLSLALQGANSRGCCIGESPSRRAAARHFWLQWCALGLMWCAAVAGFRPPAPSSVFLLRSAEHVTASDSLRMTFVAVGHGLSVLIQTGDGQQWLYDAGATTDPQATGQRIVAVMREMGVTRLDGIVLSHFDADHFNAVPYITERFPVGVVMTSDRRLGEAVRATTACRVQWLPLQRGGGVLIPQLGRLQSLTTRGADNERSLVLSDGSGQRFCLTGDLEGEGLDRLLSRDGGKFDVLLVPHHGSRHSRPPDVAQWAAARWAVISGGWRDRDSEVLESYRRAGTQVLNTADGAITIGWDGKRLSSVRQWRSGRWLAGKWQSLPLGGRLP